MKRNLGPLVGVAIGVSATFLVAISSVIVSACDNQKASDGPMPCKAGITACSANGSTTSDGKTTCAPANYVNSFPQKCVSSGTEKVNCNEFNDQCFAPVNCVPSSTDSKVCVPESVPPNGWTAEKNRITEKCDK